MQHNRAIHNMVSLTLPTDEHTLESQDFPQKLFFSFWWGMRNLWLALYSKLLQCTKII